MAVEKSISLSKLREATILEMRNKIVDLEMKLSDLESLRDAKTELEKIRVAFAQKMESHELLAEKLKVVEKYNDRLSKQVDSTQVLLEAKSEEVNRLTEKARSSEDVQERHREQIVKDANQISDLGSQVSLLNTELMDVKGKSQEIIVSYCEFVNSFGVRLSHQLYPCQLRVY